MWTLMKSSSSAICCGTNPEVSPGRSKLQSTRPTVTRWRWSCLRMGATRCFTHRRGVSGRGGFALGPGLVVPADGGDQVLYPPAGDLRPRALGLVQGDDLDKVLTGEGRPQPVTVFALASRDDRLVHQVI